MSSQYHAPVFYDRLTDNRRCIAIYTYFKSHVNEEDSLIDADQTIIDLITGELVCKAVLFHYFPTSEVHRIA
jgi:hypothetical protein